MKNYKILSITLALASLFVVANAYGQSLELPNIIKVQMNLLKSERYNDMTIHTVNLTLFDENIKRVCLEDVCDFSNANTRIVVGNDYSYVNQLSGDIDLKHNTTQGDMEISTIQSVSITGFYDVHQILRNTKTNATALLTVGNMYIGDDTFETTGLLNITRNTYNIEASKVIRPY